MHVKYIKLTIGDLKQIGEGFHNLFNRKQHKRHNVLQHQAHHMAIIRATRTSHSSIKRGGKLGE